MTNPYLEILCEIHGDEYVETTMREMLEWAESIKGDAKKGDTIRIKMPEDFTKKTA